MSHPVCITLQLFWLFLLNTVLLDVFTLRPLSLIHSFSLLCSIPLDVNITVLICFPGDKHLDWGSRITLSTRDFQEADTKMESDVQEMN